MEFRVIIPVYNAGEKIKRTLESVAAQSSLREGKDSVHCLVVDGGSSDDTFDHVTSMGDSRIEVISEPDSGMYDALAKGLSRIGQSGDVTCYLPAGEMFDPSAFSIVSDVFGTFSKIHWLQGQALTRNLHGQITDSTLPYPYRRQWIECGIYGTRLHHIQQESTFWRSALNTKFDLDILRSLKLAGDFFLWRSLARDYELYVVNAHLAAFTVEPGQLSAKTPGAYREELCSLCRKPTLMEKLHVFAHRKMTKRRRPKNKTPRLVSFHHDTGQWRLKGG